MGIIQKVRNSFRANTNPSPLMDEQISRVEGTAYVDPLIAKDYNNYLSPVHRMECCYQDAILNALTYRWAIIATTKTFKFYESHEIDAMEVMQDYRQWWILADLDDLLMSIIPILCRDGHSILEPWVDLIEENIGYEIMGDYECAPNFWRRDNDNEIIRYLARYIPRPVPFAGFFAGGHGLQKVDKEYYPDEVLHLTRGDENFKFGRSRIQPVWDSATKLRHGSHADFFRKDTRFLIAIPEGWKKERARSFARTMNDFLGGRRRAFMYKMEQASTPDKTPLELPRFGFQSLSQPAPKPLSQSEAGGQLLRDPEWARLLSATGHTENYFLGNQAGAVVGSEVDLTRDDRTEMAEFALYEPAIKMIINWFVERDLIPAPPGDYVIKYWKDWEFIEKQAKMVETELKMQEGETKDKAEGKEKAEQHNSFSEIKKRDNGSMDFFIKIYNAAMAIKKNINMPMTPVASSFAAKVGAWKNLLLIKYHHDPDTFAYPYMSGKEEEMGAEAYKKYQELTGAGSKGGWIWDNILMKPSVYGMEKGKLFQKGSRIRHFQPPGRPSRMGPDVTQDLVGEMGMESLGTPEEMREVKEKGIPEEGIIGAGKTREPYRAAIPEEQRPLGTLIEEAIAETAARGQPKFITMPKGAVSMGLPQQVPLEGVEAGAVRGKPSPRGRASPEARARRRPVGGGGEVGAFLMKLLMKAMPKAPRNQSALNASKLSLKKYNIALKDAGIDTIGQKTYQKIRKAQTYYNNFYNGFKPRYNSFFLKKVNSVYIGNPMNFDIPLYYPADNEKGYIKEYACKQDWRGIENHIGDIYLYEDLEHGGDQYKVGEYKHWWDEDTDMPLVQYEPDEDLIRELHNQFGFETSTILELLDAGKPPEMSTEYYSRSEVINGRAMQRGFINSKGEPRLQGIAIVKAGNCGKSHCQFTRIENTDLWRDNSKTKSEWISCCMRKHGPKGDGTMKHSQCVAAASKKFGK